MRIGLSILLIAVLMTGSAIAVDTQNEYSPARVEAHVRTMMLNPYVSPTPSCNSTKALPSYTGDPVANYVIGHTPGNLDGPNAYGIYVPEHNIYAYKISDPCSTGPKLNIVVTSGNHNTETSGTWAMQGMAEFFASDEPQAIHFRQLADVYVYPLSNPDGRYTGSDRANPEVDKRIDADTLPPYTLSDHNRLWNLEGWGLSTIDSILPAMKADTGGQAEYFFDYHGGGTTYYYTLPQLFDCPFATEFAALDSHDGGGDPVLPHLERPGDYRMTRVWAMRTEGLNARFGIVPENDKQGTVAQRLALGRLYGLATYNAILKGTPLADRLDLKTMSENWLVNNLVPRQEGDQLLGQWNFDNNDVSDSSGNGHNGVIVGNMNIVDDPCRGLVLNCPGGAGNYVNCGGGGSDTWADGLEKLTITVWAQIDHYTTEYQYITAKEGAWRVMRMNLTTNTRFYTEGTAASLLANNDIQGGKWHHIAAVYDGSYKYIYIDGALENSVARTESIHDSDYNIIIGGTERSDSVNRTWKGLIDDVRIYNYALTADEIQQIYEGEDIESPTTTQVLVCQEIPSGDMNNDCIVNFLDFAVLASTWLQAPEADEGILSKGFYSDNVSTYEFIDMTSSHNVGGGDNRILIVALAAEDNGADDMEVKSITYNNVEMIPVPDSDITAGSSNKVGARFYYLLEEDLPEPGYYTVAVTYKGSVLQRLGGSISRSGVVQQAPVCLATNSNTGQNSISTNITVLSDNAWIVDTVSCDALGSFTTTSNGMTEWWDISGNDGGSTIAGSCKTQSQAGPTTMSWNYSATANIMVHSIIECELLD